MDFSIGFNFITGVMLGIEFTRDEEGSSYAVLDLLILRLIFAAHPYEE